MTKKLAVIALALLMAAPLDAGAASWRAPGMSGSSGAGMDHGAMSMTDGDHRHLSVSNPGGLIQLMDSHDHDADNCGEHCMNCNNHCSNTAVLSDSFDCFDYNRRFAIIDSGDLLPNFSDLLFRPPISA